MFCKEQAIITVEDDELEITVTYYFLRTTVEPR